MNSPWFEKKYSKLVENVIPLILKVKNKDYRVFLDSSTGAWVYSSLNKNKDNFTEAEKEFLYKRGMVKDKEGNYVEIERPKIQKCSPSSFVLNLTLNCNLSCKYCFAEASTDFKKPNIIKEDVIKRTVDEISKVPHKRVRLEFQGGEPLIAKDSLFFALNYAKEKIKSKSITFGMETNGTLIDEETVKLLEKFNFTIGISIDGPEKIHDLARVYPNGKGSFQETEAGLDLLIKSKKLKEKLGSIVVVGKHNCNRPKEVVEYFNKKNITFKPIPANPAGRATENIVATSEEYYNFFIKAYEYSEKLKLKNIMSYVFNMNVYTPLRDYICLRSPCGMGNEIISINPDGSVRPCDGFKSNPEFEIGNILNEDLSDIYSKEKTKKLSSRSFKDIEKCSKCNFKGMCGPCAYASYGLFGSIYREDPKCLAKRKIFIYLMKRYIERSENKKRD